MSRKPRYIVAGATHVVCRRVVGRQFMLIPTPAFRNAFFYWFAVYAKKHGIGVYQIVLMSNHYHALLLDKYGKMPKFLCDFHARMGHVVKFMFDHEDALWERQERCNIAEVGSAEAFVSVSHYIINNPVSAGITDSPQRWPGLITDGEEEFKVPDFELKKKSSLALNIRLPMEKLVGIDGYSKAQLDELIQAERKEKTKEAACEYRREGKGFLGVLKALRSSRVSRPKRGKQRKRRRSSPQWVAVTREAIECIKEKLAVFYKAYRKAYSAYQAGNSQVVFPHGTWKMVRVHGCACAVP